MKKKKFDCVAMQHKAGEQIYEETKDMTFEQRLAYWQEKNRAFEQMLPKKRAARKSA
jgi:hypothetical protein